MYGQAVSTNGGSIQGTITDASGAAIPNATVVVSSPETGYTHALQTDKSGYYSLGPLVPGSYSLDVTAPNFQKLHVSTVIRVGTVTPGSEKLSVGNSGETVEVNAGALQVNTDQPGVSGIVTREQMESLPINGRNVLDVAQLQPGVILESGESFDPTKAGYSAVSVGGVSGRTTRILLDGQDITDETVGTTLYNVPTGAVDEFQLNRSTQDVSGEVTSTGQVLVSTRSGTNAYHGQLFYDFQDNNAGFADINGFNAPFQRNQFGGDVGGFLIKDKLFFFGDVERVKQDQQNAVNTSASFGAIQAQYPLTPAPFRDTFSIVRLDYNAPKGIHLFVRGVYSVNSDTSNFGYLYSVYNNRDNVPGIAGGADFTTGKFTHSFRVGYEKFHNLLGDETASVNSIYNPFPLGGPNGALTLFDTSDNFFAGVNFLAPQQTYQSDKQFRYDGTWTRGAHSVKFGGEVNRIQNGGFAGFYSQSTLAELSASTLLSNCYGNPQDAPCPDDPVNGYSAYRYIMGNGNGAFSENPGFGEPSGGLSSWRVAAYAADTWKVTPAVTLVAGLRWSVDTDRANQDLATPPCSSLDPALQFSGCNATSGTNLFDQYQQGLGQKTHQPYANFGPQAGIVVSPGDHKTSIRLGGGIFYESSIFNNTGNARPETITATGAFFNDALPCANFFPGSNLDYSKTLISGQTLSAICGMSIANAAPYMNTIRQAYQAQTAGVSIPNPNYIGSENGYDLYADNIYAGPYVSPYSIQLNGGLQRQLGKGFILSADYVHNATLKVPLSIDVNHVGAARYLDLPSAQAAITATLTQCGVASIQAAIQACPGLHTDPTTGLVMGATLVDFSNNGLDSGNNQANTSGVPAVQSGAAFGGRNRNVGTGQFILPIGKSGYDAMQLVLQQQASHPAPGIVSSNLQISYNLSRIDTMTSSTTTTEDQFFGGALAWDFDRPSSYMGRSTLDHTNQLSFGGSLAIKYGVQVGFTGHFFSAPAQSLTLDNQEFGGQGEIFRTDVTGDGTTGDLVPSTNPGYYMHQVKGANLSHLISAYNTTNAGQPTPAGQALINAGLFTLGQLQQIGAVQQPIGPAPTNPLKNAATRTFDLNAGYPIRLSRLREGLSLEPSVAMYNVFNMSNFTIPSTVLLNQDDAGGGSGYFNTANSQAALNAYRVERGSGTFDQGGPRTTEFQLKLNF